MAIRFSNRRFLTLKCFLLVGVLWVSLSHAAALSPAAGIEINALLSRLESSGCQFRRNGTWYSAAEAQAHLRRKLDYLVNEGSIVSAEQFIERAASKSSISGQAYLVKCGGTPPVPSEAWLHASLKALRSVPSAPPK